jgi:hypothetical protein
MFSKIIKHTFRPGKGNGNNDKYFLTIGAGIVAYISSKRSEPPSAGNMMLIQK